MLRLAAVLVGHALEPVKSERIAFLQGYRARLELGGTFYMFLTWKPIPLTE